MLLDILGIIIGFAAIMLLLSLIVTSLVQATQHLFKMRAQNLLLGLSEILQIVAPKMSAAKVAAAKNMPAPEGQTTNPPSGKDVAEAVLRQGSLLVPNTTREKIMDLFVARDRSWITCDELTDSLQEIDPSLSEEDLKKVEKKFKRTEDILSKRFASQMRLVAIAWSLVIAFLFQVNAFELIRNFAASPQLRAAAEQAADVTLMPARDTQTALRKYEDVSDEALRTLAANHQDLAPQIDEATGLGADKSAIVDELRAILADVPEPRRDNLVAEYEDLLDELHAGAVRAALDEGRKAFPMLAAFDIRPWNHGWDFYMSSGWQENWAGMFLVMLALTLGAPFWFTVLQTAAGLRDALKPDSKENSNG